MLILQKSETEFKRESEDHGRFRDRSSWMERDWEIDEALDGLYTEIYEPETMIDTFGTEEDL